MSSSVNAVARRKVVRVAPPHSHAVARFAVMAPGFKKWDDKDGSLIFACTAANLDAWDQQVGALIQDADGSVKDARMPALTPLQDMPLIVKAPMFEHQRWMVSTALQRSVFGTFFDMGTGKSAIALWMAAEMFLRGMIDQLLFVTVTNNVKPFMTEQLNLHMPAEPRHIVVQIPSTQFDKLGKVTRSLLIGVCGHGAFQGVKSMASLNAFVKRGRTLLVIDESTGFKGWSSKRLDNMLKLRSQCKRVYLMTGDPTPLGLEDLFSQFYILDSRIIGHASLTSFRNRYCVMAAGAGGGDMVVAYRNKEELYDKISPYCRFVKITDCHDMPPQTFLERSLKMEPEQRRVYNEILAKWKAILATGDEREVDNARAKFVALQNIGNGWVNDDNGVMQTLSTARARLVTDEVHSIAGKVVVWCAYHGDIALMARMLAADKISFVEFHGNLSKDINSANREIFLNDPDCKVFLATAASGGTALNLQVASHMIYFSNTFNYGHRSQSERRIWRIGQEAHCIYLDVLVSAIDRHILRNLKGKRDLSREVQTLAGMRKLAEALELEEA